MVYFTRTPVVAPGFCGTYGPTITRAPFNRSYCNRPSYMGGVPVSRAPVGGGFFGRPFFGSTPYSGYSHHTSYCPSSSYTYSASPHCAEPIGSTVSAIAGIGLVVLGLALL